MAELVVPKVDFSPLGDLGNIYKEAQKERGLQDAFSQGIGSDPQSLAALAQRVAPHNPQLAINLAQLAHGYTRQATQDSRQASLDQFNQSQDRERLRLAQNADMRAAKAADEDKTTIKEVQNADGTTALVRVPLRGDAGPIAGTTSAPAPRNMSVSDITKLQEEGGKYADATRFAETFKPEYAGHTILGEGPNVAGRILPEAVVGKSTAEGADWWQSYDRFKNLVRNELFGSALTAPEKAAFEKADINPRMDPERIKKNLALQKAITERGIRNKADAMISAGYKPETIAKAYGVDSRMLGGGASPAASQPKTTGPTGPTRQIPPAAIEALRSDPSKAAEFDAYYGPGMSRVVLR
jgi:hypothetical protein